MSDQRSPETNQESPELQIRLEGLEEVRPEYSNLAHVTFDPDSFQMVFSRATQPITTSEQEKVALFERGYIPAMVVARIILAPNVIRQLSDLILKQIERYDSTVAVLSADSSAAPAGHRTPEDVDNV